MLASDLCPVVPIMSLASNHCSLSFVTTVVGIQWLVYIYENFTFLLNSFMVALRGSRLTRQASYQAFSSEINLILGHCHSISASGFSLLMYNLNVFTRHMSESVKKSWVILFAISYDTRLTSEFMKQASSETFSNFCQCRSSLVRF